MTAKIIQISSSPKFRVRRRMALDPVRLLDEVRRGIAAGRVTQSQVSKEISNGLKEARERAEAKQRKSTS